VAEASSDKPTVGAAQLAAGGGSGGILVYIVHAYVKDPNLQTLFLYLVPSVSVVVASVYSRAVELIATLSTDKFSEYRRKQMLKRAQHGLEAAKSQLRSIEADEKSTAEHKAAARDDVQAFERAVLDLHSKGIITVDASPVTRPTRAAQ
jgi:hypothetical protein